MALNTNWAPGDGPNQILTKLLILFGGSPKAGDGVPQLLKNILQQTANQNGAVTPVTPADLTALETHIESQIPQLFDDSGTGANADAVISQRFVGVEIEAARFKSGQGYLEMYCAAAEVNKRIQLSNDLSALSILGSTLKSKGAFIDICSQNYTGASGNVHITTANRSDDTKGLFKILNQAADSSASTTRLTVYWDGHTTLSPVLNNGATTFSALKLDITNTASAAGSMAFDVSVGGAVQFSVGMFGNVIQAVESITYAASVEIDFNHSFNRTISITGNVEFTTANTAAGKEVCVKVLCDSSQRTLTFPATWKFMGTKPANIAANKTGVLSLRAYGSGDANVIAAWGVEA